MVTKKELEQQNMEQTSRILKLEKQDRLNKQEIYDLNQKITNVHMNLEKTERDRIRVINQIGDIRIIISGEASPKSKVEVLTDLLNAAHPMDGYGDLF